MDPTSITSINRLPGKSMQNHYSKLIPPEVLQRFNISENLHDSNGNSLFKIKTKEGYNAVELFLYHQHKFQDPIIYTHLADTLNDQIHILLYIMNDPESPRYDVDVMPDGTPTKFGTDIRNLKAESQAMHAGLSPGQIRKGLSLASEAQTVFEDFIQGLGHDRYFAEPLYYHNAVIFERFGFNYQSGRKHMQNISAGFESKGEYRSKLDGSEFRSADAHNSIRLRSWAIHDGILGEPFTNVTMYKSIAKHAGINTVGTISW